MWIRGTFLIIFALLIDGLQAIMAWILLAMGSAIAAGAPIAGTIGGAALGCIGGGAVGAGAGAFVGGVGAIPGLIAGCAAGAGGGGTAGAIAGGIVGAMGPALGIGVGFAVDIAISITMGSGLILALVLFGMFDIKYVAVVFIGESLPGLDVIPGWTFLVIRCILKKNAEQAVGIAGVASKLASGALSPGSATGLGMVTAGLSVIKDDTGAMARTSPLVRKVYDSEPVQKIARERTQLTLDVGREITSRTTNNINSTNQLHAKTT